MLHIAPARAPIQKQYTASLSRLMLTTALVGAFSIGGTQAWAQLAPSGGIFVEDHQGINHTNATEVSTTDLGVIGIHLLSGNSFINPTDGAIPGGNVSLSNNVGGNISTGGEYAYGIEARAAAGSVSINNGATVSTTGEGSSAIHGFSGNNGDGEFDASYVGGDVSITNSGTVTTEENFAYGIVGKSNGGEVTINNSGTISTAEDQSWGLEISSGAASYGGGMSAQVGEDISVLNSGTISTMGTNSFGIYMSTYGGDVQANLVASSGVSTTGENSAGLYAYLGYEFTESGTPLINGGDITANIAGSISTVGQYSNAVDLATFGGDISIINSGTITATGLSAGSIYAQSEGGKVTVKNSGSVSTENESGHGIYAVSNSTFDFDGNILANGDDLKLENSGNVSTTGDYSEAIWLSTDGGAVQIDLLAGSTISTKGYGSQGLHVFSGGFYAPNTGGDVTANLAGTISTQGFYSAGAFVETQGGDITFTSSAAITVAGDDSRAIELNASDHFTNEDGESETGGNITATNLGALSTTGNRSIAIDAASNGGAIEVTNEGAITTTGNDAVGIALRAESYSNGDGVSGGTINLTNSVDGDISNEGEYSGAIHATTTANTINIDNSAELSTKGDSSSGINIHSNSIHGNDDQAPRAGGDISIANSGSISTIGQFSPGIAGHSDGGNVTINNSGSVSTENEHGAGISLSSSRRSDIDGNTIAIGGDLNLTNSGTVTTSGQYANGLHAQSDGGTVSVNNSGSVSTDNEGNSGISVSSNSTYDIDGNALTNGGDLNLVNSGSVSHTAGNSAAVWLRTDGGAIQIDLLTGSAISTVGENSQGLSASTGEYGAPDSGGDIVANLAGTISTEGINSAGAYVDTQGGDITFSSSAAITIAGHDSHAIELNASDHFTNEDGESETGGNVTATNLGALSTTGDFSAGYNAFSNGGTINVTNGGEITTTGFNSRGILLGSGNSWDDDTSEGGNVTLTNNVAGNISTDGDNSSAINVWSSTGNVSIINHADLSTEGAYSQGVGEYSGSNRENAYSVPFVGGDIAIANSGTITTQGMESSGLDSWSNGGMVTLNNSGTVSTSGDNSSGLDIGSGTNRTEDDRVVTKGGNVTGTNSGSVSTTGSFSRAIELWTYGGDIQADLTASSNVSTTGDDSYGLSAYTGNTRTEGGRVPLAGGDITANLAGSISTEGRDSWALDIATPGGDITFMSKATLSTGGENARAINLSSGDGRSADGRVPAAGGTITATNLGNLSTLGANSNGFMAYSHGGTVSGTNAGKISTSGLHSRGIDLRSGNDWIANGDEPRRGGNVVLTNNVGGDISTSGDESNAMQAASSTGNIVVSNSAVISTIGDESHGVAGFGGSNRDNDNQVVFVGGSVSVANSGSVTTKGLDSNGMEGWSNGGAVTANNSGTISTAGADSVGMAAYSGTNQTLDGRVVQTGSNVTISNSGSVSTSGNSSNGVEAFSYGGAVRVNLASSSVISTTGDNSHAVGAYSGDSLTTGERVPRAGGTIVVNLNGRISTSGAHSDGVSTGTYGGNITLTNNATITASGSSSEGLYVASGSLGEAGQVAHNGGIVTINNNSRVAVSGVDSSAIRTYSPNGTVNINNTGVLSSAKGKSIVIAAAARTAITNSGSLQSGATLSHGTDTLTNTGTLTGNFDFSNGNDTLNLNAGSVHSGASFDGGAGIDTANLNSAGALTGTFRNFETGNLASGSWTLSNSWGSFNTLNTSNGTQLALNNGILGAAQLNLASGSTLRGSGTISGGVANNGSILLASSDTLKVKGNLHSSAGSKVEFGLGSASHSKIEVTGGRFTFDNSKVLNIAVDENTNLNGDTRYKVATADGGVDDLSTANDSAAVELTDNSAAFSFDRTIEGNALWVAPRSTVSSMVSQLAPDLAEEAGVIEEFMVESGAGGELAAQMNGLSEQELVVAVRELTAPNEAAGAQALTSIVNTANNIVNTRISGRVSGGRRGFNIGGRSARNSYSAEAGQTEVSRVVMAYGNEGITGSRWLDENGYTQAWVQAFWGFSGIENSDSNQYGTAVGLDFRPDDSILIGGTFSYSRTDSDAPNSNMETDSYGGMLYGAKGFDSGLSLSGVIGFFHAQNDTRRDAFGSTYRGEYGTDTFTLSGNIAQEIEMASWLFTPNAGVRYARASFDTYTETNGPAPQTISRDNMDSIELSAQASFSRNFEVSGTQGGLFEFHAGALYEVGDSDSTVSYRFSPTGSVLTSNAGVPRLKFNVGAVVDVALTDRISTEFGYEGTFASDYSDHLVRAKFKLKF